MEMEWSTEGWRWAPSTTGRTSAHGERQQYDQQAQMADAAATGGADVTEADDALALSTAGGGGGGESSSASCAACSPAVTMAGGASDDMIEVRSDLHTRIHDHRHSASVICLPHFALDRRS